MLQFGTVCADSSLSVDPFWDTTECVQYLPNIQIWIILEGESHYKTYFFLPKTLPKKSGKIIFSITADSSFYFQCSYKQLFQREKLFKVNLESCFISFIFKEKRFFETCHDFINSVWKTISTFIETDSVVFTK